MSNILKTREKGNLIVISGPSGAGKETIIKSLLSSVEGVWLSISMTSREMRKGDIPDVSYYFVSKEEFEDRIEKGIFLEYATYNGNYYGTPKDKIVEKLNAGFDVILEIEIQGALKVKELIPDAILETTVDENRTRISTVYTPDRFQEFDENKKEEIDVICNQIVDLALLANKELNADELDLFIKRSNQLMSKVINL